MSAQFSSAEVDVISCFSSVKPQLCTAYTGREGHNAFQKCTTVRKWQ